jgi:transglycosylase-like protein with SLT domain
MLLLGLLVIAAILYLGKQATATPDSGGGGTPDGGAPAPAPPAPDPAASAPLLPGPHNEWDNQIVYALSTVGFTDLATAARFKAIIMHESGFDPGALGDARAGAVYISASAGGTITGYCSFGLGQVNNCAHPDLGAAYDLLDGNQNLLAAAQIFAGCLEANGRYLDAATRCYNGSGAATWIYLAAVKTIAASWGV